MDTTEELVKTSIADTVGGIVISRPRALNALNAAVLAQLHEAVAALAGDERVRVIVISGEGGKAFVAGADISEFDGAAPADALALAGRIRRVMDAIAACPKPVIAMIEGYALGGGFELALACDVRIAATSAQFGLPEIKLGILPGGGGTVRLSKIAGSSVARHLAMTGDMISAARAFDLGLVAAVHEPDELAAATRRLAAKLAGYSPFALARLKQSLNVAVDAATSAALDYETDAFALCFSTEDQQEGAKAFLEKRKPVFSGR